MAGLNIGDLFGRISLEDAFTGVLGKVESALESASGDAKAFGETVKSAIEDPLAFAKTETLAFLETLGPVGVVTAAAAVSIGAVGVGMFELAEHAASAAEEVERFNHVTGVTVEEVSQLKAVTEIGGSSLGAMEGMLFQVERRLATTGEGAQKVNRALADMKINSDEFRNAAPVDRIQMLSEGLHSAQGSATLMADAMAVMGRGAKENIPFLLKNFDEMEERAKAVAYVWSEEDVAAGEKFEQQVAALRIGLQTLSTGVGVEFMKDFSFWGEAAAEHADMVKASVLGLGVAAGLAFPPLGALELAGAALVGTWKLLKFGYDEATDALGNSALAEQTAGALADTMARKWAEAAKSGLSLGDASYSIAKSMIEQKYSLQTVAEQTGLTEKEVQALKSTMDNAAKSGIAAGEAWERVNQAFDGFSDVDEQTKGLVKDMFDAKVSIEDMALVTKLSKDTLKSLTDQFKEAEKAEKEFGKAWEDLNSLGTDFKATLDGIDPAIAASVKYYADMGAKVDDLVKAFPSLTKAQAEAAVQGKKAADDLTKAWENIGTLWETVYEKKAELTATDSEKIVLQAEKEYEARVKAAQEAGIIDVAYYNELWALRRADIENNQEALDKQDLAKKQQYLKDHEARNQEEAAIKQHMEANAASIGTMGPVVKDQANIVDSLAAAWDLVGKGVDATKIKVKALSGEMETLAEAQKRFDMGSSFTYDMSTDEGIQQYRKMNPAANITWSNQQIEAYIKKGGTLQGLIASGVIFPYGNGNHAALGGTVTVGEHGPEMVSLPVGSTVFPHGTAPSGSGGGDIHIHPGAIVLQYPIMNDRAALQQVGRLMGDAIVENMRGQGWRPSGPVNR